MKKRHILIVEDSIKLAELLKDYLVRANFSASIIDRGDTAAAVVKSLQPDLILLDLMLPGKDGLDVCREIRSFSTVPIIMITARIQESEMITGLEAGADDYICKPFSPRVATARVEAVLRRIHPEPSERLVSGPVVLNPASRSVTINGANVNLTASEFDLLKILMEKPGRVFSRGDLVSQVLGYDYEGYDRTIDSHIKNLRKKLAEHMPDKKFIKTIYGAGYTFDAGG